GRNPLGRKTAHCWDRCPWRACGDGRRRSGGETARYRDHCGAHIGSLSTAAGSEEGPSVRHPALHVLTGDLGNRIAYEVRLALELANLFSNGVVQQFPDRFKGRIS